MTVSYLFKMIIKTCILILFLAVAGCKKETPPSQNGANTISAKVDGNKWAKKSCISCVGGGSGISVTYDNTFFGVTGQNADQNISISLVIKSLSSTGTYELSSQESNYARVFNNNNKILYYTNTLNIGKVTVTKLDLVNKIISGSFEFVAADENNPGKKVNITNGYFDVTFQ